MANVFGNTFSVKLYLINLLANPERQLSLHMSGLVPDFPCSQREMQRNELQAPGASVLFTPRQLRNGGLGSSAQPSHSAGSLHAGLGTSRAAFFPLVSALPSLMP